jgi:vacuolar-type H+-ATPase subunit I/STV1
MQAAIFIGGFLLILGLFISFINWLSNRLSERIAQQTFNLVERLIISGIVLGVLGMFQPWLFVGYKIGFFILLFSTLAFIVWSHVTPAAVQYDEAPEVVTQ